MINRSVPGQIDLFNIEDYGNSNVASGMSMGISITSTRTKVSPHRIQIKRETLDRAASKLTLLPPLNSPQPNYSKD